MTLPDSEILNGYSSYLVKSKVLTVTYEGRCDQHTLLSLHFYAFVHASIQQIFIQQLLCARHSLMCRDYNSKLSIGKYLSLQSGPLTLLHPHGPCCSWSVLSTDPSLGLCVCYSLLGNALLPDGHVACSFTSFNPL